MTSQTPPLTSWLLAIRPKTLTAALVPIVVGTTLAQSTSGRSHLDLSLFALLCALLIQIGTNFINDALDFEKGADTAERIGPQRVTQSGLLSSEQVWRGGMLAFMFSVVLALPLVAAGGWPIILIGILSILAGYAYTGGPYPLAYVGLGDLFVVVFFGWVAVGGIYYLNADEMTTAAWVAGTQVGLLSTVMIAINNLRDHKTDREVGKKTLAVRLGPSLAKIEIALLSLLPFVGSIYWWKQGMTWAALLPFGIFPLALFLVKRVFEEEPSAIYNRFLARGALLHLAFGILLSIGLMIR